MTNLTPPHSEDFQVTIDVHIQAEIVIINEETQYFIANQNIDEMSLEELKAHIVELMEEGR